MPRGTPTDVIRLPRELLERIDADLERRGKASRTEWLTDLASALLDGRIVNAQHAPAAPSDRPVRAYPKPDRRGKA
jgi:hypothetical protein